MAADLTETTRGLQVPVTLASGKKYTKTFNNVGLAYESYDTLEADYVQLFEPGTKVNTTVEINKNTYETEDTYTSEA